MSDYKFNIGDMVRILRLDEYSYRGMEADIGKIGVVAARSKDEGVVGYDIIFKNDDRFTWFYLEDSLELINEEMIRKYDVLSILYETKEGGIFNYGIICDLIRRVRELPCK